MTSPNTVERKALLDRFARAREDARVNGQEASDYFLDKCGAEAGDTYEPSEVHPSAPQPARNPWAVLFGDSWLGRLLKH